MTKKTKKNENKKNIMQISTVLKKKLNTVNWNIFYICPQDNFFADNHKYRPFCRNILGIFTHFDLSKVH